MGFLFRVLVNAFAIYLVAEIVPGITVASVPAALGAGLVLGLINAVVRPILVVLTLPVTLLTHGLFLLVRSEEHTSELQSQSNLVCRLLLEKKKKSQKLLHTPSR